MAPPVKELPNKAFGLIMLNALGQDLLIKLNCEIIIEGKI